MPRIRDADFVAMLIDSEDPVTDPEKPWEHLKKRDNWDKPPNAKGEQSFESSKRACYTNF